MDIRAPIKCPRSTLQGSDLQTESWSQAKARDVGAEEGASGGGGPSPARLSALTGAGPHQGGSSPGGGGGGRGQGPHGVLSSRGRVLTWVSPHRDVSSPGRVLMGGVTSRGRVLHRGVSSPGPGWVLTRACPHLGESSQGRVLTGGVSSRGRVLTRACPHRAHPPWGVSSPHLRSPGLGDSDPQGLQPRRCLFAHLLPVFGLLCLFSQGEHPSVGSPLSGSSRVSEVPSAHRLMSAL